MLGELVIVVDCTGKGGEGGGDLALQGGRGRSGFGEEVEVFAKRGGLAEGGVEEGVLLAWLEASSGRQVLGVGLATDHCGGGGPRSAVEETSAGVICGRVAARLQTSEESERRGRRGKKGWRGGLSGANFGAS